MAKQSTLADLKPDPKNARKHTPRNVGMIEEALGEVGAARSIVIDENNTVLAGNATIEAAAARGLTKLQIVDADGETIVAVRRSGLTKRQKTRLALYDNRAAELAEWDADVLGDLDTEDLAGMFSSDELGDLLGADAGSDADAEPQIDRADELRKEWGVERGQLWQLGEHRLLCGDSTCAEDVARVMGGEQAQMVFTDPPYGVDYDGGTTKRRKLEGDANTDLYAPCCRMAATYSDAKAALYLWHAGVKGIAAAAAAAAAAAGYEIRCELVWNKNIAQFGALSAQYKQKHEPAYYCFKRGHAPRWFGPTNEVTVWDVDRASTNEFHPTQKPPDLAVRAMSNSSEDGDAVLDLFGGSGSTIIACEQLNRRCRAIEIDPGYVAVTLQRYLDATGKTPELVEDGDRQTA